MFLGFAPQKPSGGRFAGRQSPNAERNYRGRNDRKKPDFERREFDGESLEDMSDVS